MNAFALATLLAWLYFVRPNSSVVAVAVAIYVFVTHRSLVWPLIITGFAWLMVFIIYSWTHFGKPLPSYYQAGRLRIDLLPVALAGNLFSPSRGVFIYVPVVLFVGYLIVRYWNQIQFKNLIWLSVSISALHLLFVSAFANLWGDWWGGASFGPRYSTELVPWVVLLAILGIHALEARHNSVGMKLWFFSAKPLRSLRLSGGSGQGTSTAETQSTQRFRREKPETRIEYLPNSKMFSHRGEVLIGAALLGLSVFINARGATSLDTWKWSQPSTDQQLRAQLWDWRHPQFLAGLQRPAPPVEYPIIEPPVVVDVTRPEAGKYLWYGWSGEEEHLRWTDGHEATVVFGFNRAGEIVLSFKAAPFLAPPELLQQKVIVKLNGHELETLLMSDAQMRTYSVKLPQQFLAAKNTLIFQFPNAASPASVSAGSDDRVLGIKVESIEIR